MFVFWEVVYVQQGTRAARLECQASSASGGLRPPGMGPAPAPSWPGTEQTLSIMSSVLQGVGHAGQVEGIGRADTRAVEGCSWRSGADLGCQLIKGDARGGCALEGIKYRRMVKD